MLLVGLTGGIGMGKSTVAEVLVQRGVSVIDTDQIARELVNRGEPALEEIRSAFGPGVIRGDGTLDRKALGELVFNDREKRLRLEAILHPGIRARWQGRVDEWQESGMNRAWVVIPLLFETGAEKEFGLTVCVACSTETQSRRLGYRGWSDAEIKNRIASQRPISEKMDRSDRVIWNESSAEICELQVDRILGRI